MIQTILIPVDGSPNSGIALDYGLYIAPKFGASLRGLHVLDIYLIQGPMMTDISATVGLPPSCDGFLNAVGTSLQDKADVVEDGFPIDDDF